MARLVPIAIAGINAFWRKVMDFWFMSCRSECPVSLNRGVPLPVVEGTMVQFGRHARHTVSSLCEVNVFKRQVAGIQLEPRFQRECQNTELIWSNRLKMR